MALAVVQSTNGVSSDAGSIALTLNGTTAGNMLVLAVNYARDGTTYPTPTVAITGGGTFTLDGTSTTGAVNSGYGGKCRLWHFLLPTGGNKTVTVTLAGEDYAHAVLVEVSGMSAISPVDVVLTTGAGNSNAPATGTSSATSEADEIVFAMVLQNSNASTTLGVPSGYTRIDTEPAGNVYVASDVVYKIVSATGTQSATWTSNRTSQWTTLLVTYKQASAAVTASSSLSLSASATIRSYGTAGPTIGEKTVKAPDGVTNLTTNTTDAINTAATGSTFLIAAMYDNATTVGASDNKGNTYTLVGTVSFVDPVRMSVYICEDGAGGSGHTFSHELSTGSPYTSIFALETYTPGGGAPTLDDFTSARVGPPQPYVLTSPETSEADELLVNFVQYFHDGIANGSDGAGFSKVLEQPQGSGANGGAIFARLAPVVDTYDSSVSEPLAEAVLQLIVALKSGELPAGDIEGATSFALAASAALAGTGALSAATTLLLAASATGGTVHQIEGTATLALVAQATTTGAGSLEADAAVAFDAGADLAGSGALEAATGMSLTAQAALAGAADLEGASSLSLTAQALLLGLVDLEGASSLAFAVDATLGSDTDLSASATLAFVVDASIGGGTVLVGAATVVFASSAELLAAGGLEGDSALVFAAQAEAAGAATLFGDTGLAFGLEAAAEGAVLAQGASALAFDAAAEGALTVAISGTAALSFTSTAEVSAAGAAAADIRFTAAAALSGVGALEAPAALSFVPAAALRLLLPAEGAATLALVPAAVLAGRATLSGAAVLSLSDTAAVAGSAAVAGASTVHFNVSAGTAGTVELAGSSSLAFDTTADGLALAGMVAQAQMVFALTAQALARAAASATTGFVFTPTAFATREAYLILNTSLHFAAYLFVPNPHRPPPTRVLRERQDAVVMRERHDAAIYRERLDAVVYRERQDAVVEVGGAGQTVLRDDADVVVPR